MSGKFTLALIQMACAAEPEVNLQRAIERVRGAAARGAKLVCLPELFRSRYFCQRQDPSLFDLAEPVPGPTTKALGKAARETGAMILAPIFERRTAGIYHNSVALIDSTGGPAGGLAGVYRKMHIPDDPAYFEKYYFTPGDLGFHAFETPLGRIAPLICWDQWYPEAARIVALQGAALALYPTAIGWHPHEKQEYGAAQLDAWRTIQRAHAIANGIYVAVANRVGHERLEESSPGIEFWGSSFVADPFGVMLASASAEKEEILYAEIDPARIEDVRRNWPFLRDRRVDAYGGITQRFLDRGQSE